MRQAFYFWTFSIDENFVEHRTLVNGVGCNSELEQAPLDLSIWQINTLPFVLTDDIAQTRIYTPKKVV